jgi:transcriptional regulator with XRE-family HTH domain
MAQKALVQQEGGIMGCMSRVYLAIALGKRLRLTRLTRGIAQKALAQQVGITAKHLYSVEHGRGEVLALRSETVVRLAQCLGVSTDYLLGLSERESL